MADTSIAMLNMMLTGGTYAAAVVYGWRMNIFHREVLGVLAFLFDSCTGWGLYLPKTERFPHCRRRATSGWKKEAPVPMFDKELPRWFENEVMKSTVRRVRYL